MHRGPSLWAVGSLVVFLNLAAPDDSQAQPPNEGKLGRESASPSVVESTSVVESGYLIWNGETLNPPYLITTTTKGVEINGVEVHWEQIQATKVPDTKRQPRTQGRLNHLKLVDGEEAEAKVADRRRYAKRHRMRQSALSNAIGRPTSLKPQPEAASTTFDVAYLDEGPEKRYFIGGEHPVTQNKFAEALSTCLMNDNLIAHLPGEPLLVAEMAHDVDTVLAALLPDLVGDVPVRNNWTIADTVYDANDLDAWNAWLTGFTASDSFINRVDQRFRGVEDLLSEARLTRTAVIRVDWIAYPLTVLGMLLSIGALGHLLRSVPDRVEVETQTSSSRLERATATAVLLIAGLSGLDLTWTILSAQAGTMRELNPLGAQLVHDPVALSVFKISATLIGCGLLFRLRKHRKVADASWWMCLVMTVVTFRWVMFNSMFA